MVAVDEDKRLAVLRALALLDTEPEPEFDTIVNGAKQLFGCKSASMSLIDADRQWFKARACVDICETARDISFCAHAVEQQAMLIVPDARADARFVDNPLVTGEPFIRFYAGVPLFVRDSADGERLPIGTLCVFDDAPRDPTDRLIRTLKGMALVIEALLEQRRTSREGLVLALERHDMLMASERVRRQLAQAERMANIGSWRLDLLTEQVSWSDQTYAIHALTPGDGMGLTNALDFYAPADRARIAAAVAACAEHGRGYDLEVDFIDAAGTARRLHTIGEPELHEGRIVALIGVVQDITDRYRLEQALREAAGTDELTGLASRRAFNELLDAAIVDALAGAEPLAVVLLDLDHFKQVNDRLGHAAGDEVLRVAAATLRDAPYLGRHVAARLGGDEFVLLVRGASAGARLDGAIARLLADICRAVSDGDDMIPVSTTIGASRLSPDTATRAALMMAADRALYRAKQVRRGTGGIAGRATLIAPRPRDPRLADAA